MNYLRIDLTRNAVHELFRTKIFNGRTPSKTVNNKTGPRSWVTTMPEGAAITYRPAGQASSLTETMQQLLK